MKTYVVVMKQKNDDGCDYTIGCGTKYEFVEADGIEEAMRKSYAMWLGEDYLLYSEQPLYEGERELSKMFICEFIIDCPIERWLAEWERKRHTIESQRTEADEKAELARLLKKYPEVKP